MKSSTDRERGVLTSSSSSSSNFRLEAIGTGDPGVLSSSSSATSKVVVSILSQDIQHQKILGDFGGEPPPADGVYVPHFEGGMACETRETEPWCAVVLMFGFGLKERSHPRGQKTRAESWVSAARQRWRGNFMCEDVHRRQETAGKRPQPEPAGASLRHVMRAGPRRCPRVLPTTTVYCTSIPPRQYAGIMR